MHRRPSLQFNIEQANLLPSLPLTPSRKPRDHITYKDYIAILRGDPKKAECLVHWQRTGRALGEGLGVTNEHDKQKRAAPAEPGYYTNKSHQQPSGALSCHMMGVSKPEHSKMVHKVNASGEFVKSPKQPLSKGPETADSGDDVFAEPLSSKTTA
ncbi:uncharacterized protein M421DRAFT_92680 [Didymella exigua CBS 183.55]|uniref:Uncharacterized protein n=1 Tax=Didymella exigua CBS 183.55 TaxID=1150837 RepID=A0A6A5RSG0_9PLEO|nr:uncharacterized protein M421DRAFT_92680 [Didymella exigua CBS 183.55]KAF1928437.1 hypothetical protein M421DRAFT_92680 [Didymella exigua CBS 183.55]